MAFKLNPDSLPFPPRQPPVAMSPTTISDSSPTNSSSNSHFSSIPSSGEAPSSILTKSCSTESSDSVPRTPASHSGFPYTVVFPSSLDSSFIPRSHNYQTPAKAFGEGWVSSASNCPLPSMAVHNAVPSYSIPDALPRIRSPSLPNTHGEARQLGLTGHPTAVPFYGYPHLQPVLHHRLRQSVDLNSSSGAFALGDTNAMDHLPRRFPSFSKPFGDVVPSLNHYPSVPILSSPSIQGENGDTARPPLGSRRGSGPVVRWLDEVELGKGFEEDTRELEPRFQLERNRLGSKSMSMLQNTTSGRNVYIPQLDAGTSREALKMYAQRYGQVLSLRVDQNATNPSSGSRAFVLFSKAEEAVDFMNSLIHQGIACEYGKEDWQTYYKSLEDPNSSNLYIQGFLPTDSEEFVKEVLRPGVVSSAKWLTDDQGRLRGTILARLQSRAQADEVIELLDGKFVHPVSGEKLQVRMADSEAQKQFKKQMKVIEQEQHSASRRSSIPGHVLHAQEYQDQDDDYELEQERLEYLQKARMLEERLAAKRSSLSMRSQTSTFPGTPRTPSFSPLGPGQRHRHTSSSFSGTDLVTPTYTGQSNWSSRQGWDAEVPFSPLRRFDLQEQSPAGEHGTFAQGQGLHYARSSPELRKIDNPAKLLWPSDE